MSKDKNDPIDHFLESQLQLIARYGHSVVGVFDGDPAFAYSVGLKEAIGFDIICYGLDCRIAQQLINDLAVRLKAEPELKVPGVAIDKVANMPLRLQVATDEAMVDMSVTRALTGQVCARQLVYPDRAGKFPEDDGYDGEYMKMQPIRYRVAS